MVNRKMHRSLFAAAALAATLFGSAPASSSGMGFPFRVQNVPPVVAQAGIVTGTPSAQACPQGVGLGDGCPTTSIGNGLGTVQHADFFAGYAAQTSGPQAQAIVSNLIAARMPHVARPQFNVPGIDYPVGILPGKTLLDPVQNQASLPPGCLLNNGSGDNAYTVNCNGYNVGSATPVTGQPTGSASYAANYYTPVSFDSWDFSLHGGIRLIFQNWRGAVSITNSKIGGSGPNANVSGTGWWVLEFDNKFDPNGTTGFDCFGNANTCVTISNDYIDGNIPGEQTILQAIFAVNEGFTFKSNYLANIPVRTITSGTRHRPTLQDYCIFKNNYVEGYINPGNPTGIHGDLVLTNGPCGHNDYSYNVFMEPTKNGFYQSSSLYGQSSGWIFNFPSAVVTNTKCGNVTFEGLTGTVNNSSCSPAGTNQISYVISPGVTLAVTDGSGQVVNGYVTAINGMDAKSYDGSTPTTFTMSQSNTISTGVAIVEKVQAPQYDVHHNVFVNNMWASGHTNFGSMIGQLGGMTWDELTIENNWFDVTGTYQCFGDDVQAAISGSSTTHVSGNYNLTTGGKITGFGTNPPGCTPYYVNQNGAY